METIEVFQEAFRGSLTGVQMNLKGMGRFSNASGQNQGPLKDKSARLPLGGLWKAYGRLSFGVAWVRALFDS